MAKKRSTKPGTENKSIALPSRNDNDNTTNNDPSNLESSEATIEVPSTPPVEIEEHGREAGDDREPVPVSIGTNAPIPARVRDGETRRDCWERIRREGRAAGLSRRDAYDRANREVELLFPSEPAEPVEEPDPKPTIAVAAAPADQGVSGLGTLPPSWPELPANAQLQVEIAWVTANRLRVRDGTGVNLSKALSPAPSYSALSWLETSILFPAKFADISVKATAQADDETEHIRRERMAIEEIRSILGEMLEAGDV